MAKKAKKATAPKGAKPRAETKTRRAKTKSNSLGTKSAFDSLSSKQRLFVIKYLESLNGAKAYLAAGYRPRGADAGASRLLRNVKVASAIREEFETHGITREAVLMEVAKIGFGGDIADFEPYIQCEKSLRELRQDGVDTGLVRDVWEERRMLTDDDGNEIGEVVKRRLAMYDRLTAMALVARVLGIVSEKRVHSGKVDGTAAAVIMDLREKSDEELMRIAGAVERFEVRPDRTDGGAPRAVGTGET